jgi:uncharacterized SAM-binding protein YcdF (DUF218 family)
MASLLFFLRKLLPELLMPFGVSLLLLAFGIWTRRRRLALSGMVLLVVASLPAVSNSLCLILEQQYPPIPPSQCPPADLIVALSGFAGENSRFPGEIRWYYSVDRFRKAVQLFRMQKAPLLLFTDSQTPGSGHDGSAELVRRAAIEEGVPEAALRLTRPVSTTAEEALAVKEFLASHGGSRILLVSSAMHMGRAAHLFRQAGIDFIPYPVDFQADPWGWRLDRFLPNPSSLDQTEKCLHEIYGDLYYGLLRR